MALAQAEDARTVSLRALGPAALISRLELILGRQLREVQVIVNHLNPVLYVW
jgi:hypothetical protein